MEIYISQAGQQTGPYSEAQIHSMLQVGSVTPGHLAWHSGLIQWLPLAQVMGIPLESDGASGGVSEAEFFYVSTTRLIVMSVLTVSFFDIYWIYRNWRFLRDRDHRDISPFWRAFFGIFHIDSLLGEIQSERRPNIVPSATYSVHGNAIGWIILTMTSNIMSRSDTESINLLGTFIGMFSVLFLLPAQQHINRLNQALSPRPTYARWTVMQVIFVVIGCLAWIGVLFGALELAGIIPPSEE
jgi:hypothetical protein